MKYTETVRAVMADAELTIAERQRLGLDKKDELWDGVWHLVNPPKLWHSDLNTELLLVLAPQAARRGLQRYGDATGLYGEIDRNWRIPDQVYAKPQHRIEEGLTSAELVIEVRSPGDETYEKLPFYAERGVTEVLIVTEDRRFELRRLDAARSYELVPDGVCEALGVTFSTVEGPRLRVEWEGGSAEV